MAVWCNIVFCQQKKMDRTNMCREARNTCLHTPTVLSTDRKNFVSMPVNIHVADHCTKWSWNL
jgi:hypothetical protein